MYGKLKNSKAVESLKTFNHITSYTVSPFLLMGSNNIFLTIYTMVRVDVFVILAIVAKFENYSVQSTCNIKLPVTVSFKLNTVD